MRKLKSLVKWFFKSRYDVALEEDLAYSDSTTGNSSAPQEEQRFAFNPLCILKGDYEFMSGAVAIVRTESPQGRKESVYYPEQATDFYTDVTTSLNKKHRLTIQTNVDPHFLGFSRGDEGVGMITRRVVLGEA